MINKNLKFLIILEKIFYSKNKYINFNTIKNNIMFFIIIFLFLTHVVSAMNEENDPSTNTVSQGGKKSRIAKAFSLRKKNSNSNNKFDQSIYDVENSCIISSSENYVENIPTTNLITTTATTTSGPAANIKISTENSLEESSFGSLYFFPNHALYREKEEIKEEKQDRENIEFSSFGETESKSPNINSKKKRGYFHIPKRKSKREEKKSSTVPNKVTASSKVEENFPKKEKKYKTSPLTYEESSTQEQEDIVVKQQSNSKNTHFRNLKEWKYDKERDVFYCKDLEASEQPQRAQEPYKSTETNILFTLDVKSSEVPYYEPQDLSSWQESNSKHMKKQRKKLIKGTNIDIPWNAHRCLMIREGNKKFRASGVLIHPQYVLTAGHNFFNRKENTVADQITFYPAMHGEIIPFAIKGEIVVIDKEYFEKDDVNHKDLAIIKLTDTLDIETGFEIVGLTEEDGNKAIKMINITGYPGNSPFHGRFMTSSEKKCNKIENGRIFYSEKTVCGQSGSSIWVTKKSKYYLVGIHTHGKDNNGIAAFFNKDNSQRINNWIEMLNEERTPGEGGLENP